jgi:hypothetical protein
MEKPGKKHRKIVGGIHFTFFIIIFCLLFFFLCLYVLSTDQKAALMEKEDVDD